MTETRKLAAILLAEVRRPYRQVLGKVEANFADAGGQRLKNIARPVRAFYWMSKNAAAERPAPLRLARQLAATFGICAAFESRSDRASAS